MMLIRHWQRSNVECNVDGVLQWCCVEQKGKGRIDGEIGCSTRTIRNSMTQNTIFVCYKLL